MKNLPVWLLVGLVFLLLWAAAASPHKIVTDEGVNCWRALFVLSCNWQKFNYDTGYGEFQYSVEPDTIEGD